MSRPSQATLRRVKLYDRLARWVVSLGGAIVIVSVLGILILILGTTLPLFYPARVRLLAESPLPPQLQAGGVVGLGVYSPADDRWIVSYVVDASGVFRFVDLISHDVIGQADAATGLDVDRKKGPRPTLLGAAPAGAGKFALRWSNGAISLVKISAASESGDKILDRPKITLETLATIAPDSSGVPEQAVIHRNVDEGPHCAALYGGKKIVVTAQSQDLSGETSEAKLVLSDGIPSPVTAIAMTGDGTILYAGTAGGSIMWWRLNDKLEVEEHDVVPPSKDRQAITSLQLMLGDAALVAGDASGAVTNWFFVTPESDRRKPAAESAARQGKLIKEVKKLTYIRSLAAHQAAINDLVPSPRNRGLLVRDESGLATMDYTTSQRQLVALHDVSNVAFGPRGDMIAAVAGDRLKAWRVEGSLFGFRSPLYPEISWSSLWGQVWYEGLNEPEFSWQPQGAADAEPKFSLVPLVFGALKGTFYAMLLAGPLSLAAAAYVSHFASPAFRAWIKPTIELMAAVPSVVLGFIVGLWLAPLIRNWLLALFLSMALAPLVFVCFLLVWQRVRLWPVAEKAVRGRELFIAALLIGLTVALAVVCSAPLEQRFFGGDLAAWMFKGLHVVYDQNNSIIVAFGVGFLVCPIIFTLSEDALASVPHSMTAASMALGASRWQTLWRVVLPSASPGIFAAVMIGFGRAVGETMVFLMATGGTAIIDTSPFNGMRTLAFSIADELPGAPVGGTHYRTLFLCAVVLFVMTFFLNTVAEFVRQRLRRRFGQF